MRTKSFPTLIAIVGGSGAGKTWLAERLQRAFGPQAARLSQDDFYNDLAHLSPSDRAKINFDHPRALDWASFAAVLRDCREGRATRVPQYDFSTHTRLPEAKPFIPTPLILVEGLWLLWPSQMRILFDLRIYLDCPATLRLERRLSRDVAFRGRTPDFIREQFLRDAAPMHGRFVAPQARWTDINLQNPPDQLILRKLIETIQSGMRVPRTPATLAGAQAACGRQTT